MFRGFFDFFLWDVLEFLVVVRNFKIKMDINLIIDLIEFFRLCFLNFLE